MRFNQINKNLGGDVNNAITEKGNVNQMVGDGNKVVVDQPKPSFWSLLWQKCVGFWGWMRGRPS